MSRIERVSRRDPSFSGGACVLFATALFALFFCGRLPASAGPADDRTPSEEIEAKITALEARDFRTRQRATRALIKHGAAALEPLRQRVRSSRLELAIRAISVFEASYSGKDPAAVNAADEALEELAVSKRPELAEHARQALQRHQNLRTRRAVAQLRKLGGEVNHYRPDQLEREDPEQQQGQRFRNAARRDPYLILDDQWRGGAEGLKYVRRLPVPPFQIYVIDGVQVPEKALAELESEYDGPTIVRRGSAMLGVSGSSGGACHVLSVEEGTAAKRAGIGVGDIIVGYNGAPVRDFGELVGLLRNQKAGDTIRLSLIPAAATDGREIEKKVTLGKWRPPAAIQPGK